MNPTPRRLNLKYIAEIAVSPAIFLAMIWIWQFSSHFFLNTGLSKPSMFAWAVVFIGVVAFSVGSKFGLLLYLSLPRKTIYSRAYCSRMDAGAVLIMLSIPLAIFSAVALVTQVNDQGFGLLVNIKIALLEEAASGTRSKLFFAYAIIFNALSVLYYCNIIDYFASKKNLLIVILTAILCLFTGSRAVLVFFIVALFPTFIFHRKYIGVKMLVFMILMVVLTIAFFFLYPIVFQSYDFASNASWENYLSVYFFSGISAFSHFVEIGEPSYDSILTIPRALTRFIDFIFSTNLYSGYPVLFQVVDVPLATNVYSIFYQPMHDFGLVGVVLYLFVLGCACNLAYTWGFFYRNVGWRFVYCIFFFSIFMSFFEDQFARGFIYYFFAIIVLAFVWIVDKLNRLF